MILEVMNKYYPGWEPPEDDGRYWIPCECPVHGDSNPSASVNYELDSFKCHACGYAGNIYTIIMREEEVSSGEADRIAAEIATASGVEVPQSTTRQSSSGFSKPARFGSL